MKIFCKLFIIVLFCLSLCACRKALPDLEREFNSKSLRYSESPSTKVFAQYSDSVKSFEELKETAGFIVKAYTESVTKSSDFAQKATLRVNETYKGKTPERICVYQILGDNNIIEGNEYFLFLNLQEPDRDNKADYYPVGGGVGVYLA